ncbi:toxin [Photorhabdus tasmaniensis]|uniref:toxin n=1 Tax=Photorhabdus tasmaniensis TaxID=1004159 RepID=UPI004042F526
MSKYKLNRCLLASTVLYSFISGNVIASNPKITAYYLSGPAAQVDTQEYYASLDNFKKLSRDIAKNKSNFNTLVLSFVQPGLVNYEKNSLKCSGLFGYTCISGQTISTGEAENARSDFMTLKGIIADLKSHGVGTYIAVGGWNFSCYPKIYDITAKKKDACGNEPGAVYDIFPNPMTKIPRFDSSITGKAADDAYRNIVNLAADLDVAGIDVDYEEFWHADINAKSWKLTPDSIKVPSNNSETLMTSTLMAKGLGGYVYDASMNIVPGAERIPRAMPATVDKFSAILTSFYTSINAVKPSLQLSTAGPATGGIPNMSANWGTNARNSDIYGGAWWGGNLYGLIYNTALSYPKIINRLSYIGVMTYDLSEKDCGFIGGGETYIPCDLPGQVKYYYGQYINWLKSGNEVVTFHVKLKGARNYAQASVQPRKLLVLPPITVGFEVGKPATGNLPLTKAKLNSILDGTIKYGKTGLIMWDLFKKERYDGNNWKAEWATPNDVLSIACKKIGLTGEHYHCDSSVPTPEPVPAFTKRKSQD